MESSFLNPSKIVESLAIEPGMLVAEFGAGTGFFSLALGVKVGRDGKVYAFDVQKETLEALKSKARLDGVYNIECVWADLERGGSTKLGDGMLDWVLMPNMLFQSEKKPEIFKEARRILKGQGSLLIIDYYPEKAIHGEAMGWLAAPAEMQKLAEKAGFTFIQNVETGTMLNYGLLFKK